MQSKEPKILVVRRFIDDNVRVKRSVTNVGQAMTHFCPMVNPRLDALLARILARHGKILFVGNPNEPRSIPKARVVYFPDGQWQAGVDSLADDSDTVIFVVGASQNLAWELGSLMWSSAVLSKMLYVFPPLPEDQLASTWDAFRSVFQVETGVSMPETLPANAILGYFVRSDRFAVWSHARWHASSMPRVVMDYHTVINYFFLSCWAAESDSIRRRERRFLELSTKQS